MIPFAVPAVLQSLPWKWLGIGLGALAVIGVVWWVVDSIGDSREEKVRAEYEAAQRAAEAKAAEDTRALQDAVAEIDANVTFDIGAIHEVRTIWRDRIEHKAVDVFRDRPGCRLTDELRNDTNQYATELARTAGLGVVSVPADAAPAR